MPTDLQRQGDFSKTFAANGQTIVVYNPFSTRASGSAYIRDPFPNNKIPSQLFDPVAVNVVKYYPSANIAGDSVTNANNCYGTGPHLTDIDWAALRLRDTAHGTERYNRMNYFDPSTPTPLAKPVPGLTGSVLFVGVNGNSRYQYHLDTNNLGPRLGLAYQLRRTRR